jgi:hypothetical protein
VPWQVHAHFDLPARQEAVLGGVFSGHADLQPSTHECTVHRAHLSWGDDMRPLAPAVLLLLLLTSFATAEDFFTSKIEPLLKLRCFECHSHEHKIKGGLALDSPSGWKKGGESGPALVPQKPGASLLIKAVSHAEKDLKMPPEKMLPAAEIALLTEWVRLGAPDPRQTNFEAAVLNLPLCRMPHGRASPWTALSVRVWMPQSCHPPNPPRRRCCCAVFRWCLPDCRRHQKK